MILFEWDEDKEQSNIQKHGIDFTIASQVFFDESRIEFFDIDHSTGDEERFITIGAVGRILTVVYTERSESLRIISARIATRKERNTYYGNEKIYTDRKS